MAGVGVLRCQACGGSMVKKTISSGNCSGIALALIVFAIGIIIAIILPVIGWIIGALICLCALFMGGKRSKVWKCLNCGSILNRA